MVCNILPIQGEMIVFTNPSIELREDANKQDNIPV